MIPKRAYGFLATGALVIIVAAHNLTLIQNQPAAEVALRIRTSLPTHLRAFFNDDRGRRKTPSVVQFLPVNSAPQDVFIPLPTDKIQSILIYLTGAWEPVQISEAKIQRPVTHAILYRFDLAGVVPSDDGTSLAIHDRILEITTADTCSGPGLLFSCQPPLPIKYSWNQIFTARFFRINRAWSAFTLFLFLGYRFRQRWWPRVSGIMRRIDQLFLTWSRRFRTPAAFALDRIAIWSYAICLGAFAVMSMAGLHGSSIRVYGSGFRYSSVKHQPLLGTPKATRMDEWNYHTPIILNQLQRQDRFATDLSVDGPNKAALFGNVPTRHWSTWFRPQFWFFHVFPPAFAYAFYWQSKGLLLLTGIFSLLLLLTRSSMAAAFGALWYFFSAYTQWCYSWPSLLPEMVGLFGWVICLFAYLTVGRNPWWLACAALLCTLCAVNFALCAYPPHQIPLVIFGVAITLWWLYTHAHLILRKERRLARSLALIGCALSIAITLELFYLDTKIGFGEIARTLYPGQRSVGGGDITLAQLLSNFVDFWKDEKHFPSELVNMCEGTGYLWLAPAALLISMNMGMTRRGKVTILFLCFAFCILAGWMLMPISTAVGKFLLLDKVPPHRCLHALGLVNIAIVVTCLSAKRFPSIESAYSPWKDLTFGLSVLFPVLAALLYMNSAYHQFFAVVTIVTAAIYLTFLIFCLRKHWKWPLATSLLLPAMATTALVNPVDRGFDVISRSSFAAMVKERPELRSGRWLAFSPWVTLSGFVSACGIDLFNGLKIIPPFSDLARFDPDGKYSSVINQSAYLIADPKKEVGPSEFASSQAGVLFWKVHPLDPKLKEAGIKYVVFDSLPDASIRQKLKPILENEANSLFVYEL